MFRWEILHVINFTNSLQSKNNKIMDSFQGVVINCAAG